MFRFIKKKFFLQQWHFLAVMHLMQFHWKCVSMNNQECKVRPET